MLTDYSFQKPDTPRKFAFAKFQTLLMHNVLTKKQKEKLFTLYCYHLAEITDKHTEKIFLQKYGMVYPNWLFENYIVQPALSDAQQQKLFQTYYCRLFEKTDFGNERLFRERYGIAYQKWKDTHINSPS